MYRPIKTIVQEIDDCQTGFIRRIDRNGIFRFLFQQEYESDEEDSGSKSKWSTTSNED